VVTDRFQDDFSFSLNKVRKQYTILIVYAQTYTGNIK